MGFPRAEEKYTDLGPGFKCVPLARIYSIKLSVVMCTTGFAATLLFCIYVS